MYQTSDKLPADVQKFNSFQQPVTTSSFLFVRLEPDGNLKGYYWDGSKWLLNYQAITETCDLPRPCGSYGLCTPGGSACSCLDNRTRFQPGGCFNDVSGDLCGEGIGGTGNSYHVLRRSGVEPPHKELLRHVTTSSLVECEALCQNNCSCWGALYNNGTGFCYVLDHPIQTMLGTGDESKVGYFKVKSEERGKNRIWIRVGIVVTVLVMVAVIIIGGGVCVTRWKKRRGVKEEDWASPGPYKNLGSASFRSIEMYGNAR
ncbi:PAN domain-containing protein [Spatholobus suberectus]|nr:PAN domain-containing protein [Spatholobus suberectus]